MPKVWTTRPDQMAYDDSRRLSLRSINVLAQSSMAGFEVTLYGRIWVAAEDISLVATDSVGPKSFQQSETRILHATNGIMSSEVAFIPAIAPKETEDPRTRVVGIANRFGYLLAFQHAGLDKRVVGLRL